MKEQDYILAVRRLQRANEEMTGRLAALVNAMYVQGQSGCALALEAGQRIGELEKECERWAAIHINEGANREP